MATETEIGPDESHAPNHIQEGFGNNIANARVHKCHACRLTL